MNVNVIRNVNVFGHPLVLKSGDGGDLIHHDVVQRRARCYCVFELDVHRVRCSMIEGLNRHWKLSKLMRIGFDCWGLEVEFAREDENDDDGVLLHARYHGNGCDGSESENDHAHGRGPDRQYLKLALSYLL